MTAHFFRTTFAALMTWRDSIRRQQAQLEAFHAMQSRACRSDRFGPGGCE